MKAFFSAVVASLLLCIYVYLVVQGLSAVHCLQVDVTDAECAERFTDRMASSLALIGGLISALVIAELSVTPVGEVPGERIFTSDAHSTRQRRLIRAMTGLYVAVWLCTGVSAYLFGYLVVEERAIVQPISDLGQAWFGVAVGAAYAYFGIR